MEERKGEVLEIFAGLEQAAAAASAGGSSPSSPVRSSLVRSNSLLGAGGPISTHARRPSIPSPLLGDLKPGADRKTSPPPTSADLPTPSAPSTTWWAPGMVENKIGVQMSPGEWLKR